MNWMGAGLVGVAILALLRWLYWMVLQLTGDTQGVSFGWRVWLSFFVAMAIMLPLGIQQQRLADFADGVAFFDGAILHYVGVVAAVGVYCLAGAALYFLGEKSIPFRFCAVFCWLAGYAAELFVAIDHSATSH